MNRLAAELLGLFPGLASIGGFEKAARVLEPVPRSVNYVRVARIDHQLVKDQLGLVQIDQKLPRGTGVVRNIDLAVQGRYVNAILVLRVDLDCANVTTIRTKYGP